MIKNRPQTHFIFSIIFFSIFITQIETTTLYVAVDGTTSQCTSTSPCDFQTAVLNANENDVIYLFEGNYSLSSRFNFTAPNITLVGQSLQETRIGFNMSQSSPEVFLYSENSLNFHNLTFEAITLSPSDDLSSTLILIDAPSSLSQEIKIKGVRIEGDYTSKVTMMKLSMPAGTINLENISIADVIAKYAIRTNCSVIIADQIDLSGEIKSQTLLSLIASQSISFSNLLISQSIISNFDGWTQYGSFPLSVNAPNISASSLFIVDSFMDDIYLLNFNADYILLSNLYVRNCSCDKHFPSLLGVYANVDLSLDNITILDNSFGDALDVNGFQLTFGDKAKISNSIIEEVGVTMHFMNELTIENCQFRNIPGAVYIITIHLLISNSIFDNSEFSFQHYFLYSTAPYLVDIRHSSFINVKNNYGMRIFGSEKSEGSVYHNNTSFSQVFIPYFVYYNIGNVTYENCNFSPLFKNDLYWTAGCSNYTSVIGSDTKFGPYGIALVNSTDVCPLLCSSDTQFVCDAFADPFLDDDHLIRTIVIILVLSVETLLILLLLLGFIFFARKIYSSKKENYTSMND